MRKQHSKQGFTLIELLVVIAIICILAAILMPVFAAAREKANQSQCQSNLKSLGAAIAQYMQDNDETYPTGLVGATNGRTLMTCSLASNTAANGIGMGWGGSIWPYTKSAGVYQCPDDLTKTMTPNLYWCSYGMNEWLPGRQTSYLAAPTTTVCLFEYEGDTCYFDETQGLVIYDGMTQTTGSTGGWWVTPVGDGWEGWGANDYQYSVKCTAGLSTCQAAGGNATGGSVANIGARHDPSNNTYAGHSEYLMADGHVKFLNWQNVACLGWAAPANNNLSYSTSSGVKCGPFDATFNPQ
jgi:prepilin-type N-terminal cleavage/methylation domain-containing protein